MDRGERLNKSGDSWFSPKTIEVVPRVWLQGVEHCYGYGDMASYQTMANSEYLEVRARETEHRVLTSGLKRETTQTAG